MVYRTVHGSSVLHCATQEILDGLKVDMFVYYTILATFFSLQIMLHRNFENLEMTFPSVRIDSTGKQGPRWEHRKRILRYQLLSRRLLLFQQNHV